MAEISDEQAVQIKSCLAERVKQLKKREQDEHEAEQQRINGRMAALELERDRIETRHLAQLEMIDWMSEIGNGEESEI